MPQVPIIMPQLGESIAEGDDCLDQREAGRKSRRRSGNHRSRNQQSGHGRDDTVRQGRSPRSTPQVKENVSDRRGARLHRSERKKTPPVFAKTSAATRRAARNDRGNSGTERRNSKTPKKLRAMAPELKFPTDGLPVPAAAKGGRVFVAACPCANGGVAINQRGPRGDCRNRAAAIASRLKIWRIICASWNRRLRAMPRPIRAGVADAMRRSWSRPLGDDRVFCESRSCSNGS